MDDTMDSRQRSTEDFAESPATARVAARPAGHVHLATAPPDTSDRRLALAVVVLAVLGACLMAPFATVHLARLPAFIPSYEAALALIDLVTAVLLLSQFTILKRRSVLAVACAYFLSSIFAATHALSFPGGFSPVGLFGDAQTTAWLYIFWHAAFPLFVGYYALVAETPGDVLATSAAARRAASVAALAVGVVAALFIAMAVRGTAWLPVIVVEGDYRRLVTTGISPGILVSCLVVIGLMWRRRMRSVLDLWLFAVMWVWMCDVTLSAFISARRYDLGWYGGRLFGLVSGSIVLIALLFEFDRLYVRLAAAVDEIAARNEELLRSRDALARAQRFEALGQLTGGIAHDFNNLLTAMTGGLEMISRRPTDTDRVQRLAKNAMRAADRGAQLIRRLMSFARKQSLRPQVLDTNETLREFASLMANLPATATRLRLELGERVGAIEVDETEFQSAFLNLVTNARDAMPDGGEIVVSTRLTYLQASDVVEPEMTPGSYVQIAVADRGTGMPPEVRARIFEPFFTTKPRDAGTGLGLAQVYGFVRSAGGQVVADSELGLGTTIRMFLPRAEASVTPRVDGPRASAKERPAATRSVLLVEDDHDVLEATKDRVEELGYLVITAETGDEAFDLLSKGLVVDVVLSDIVMPGKLNGIQLAEAVRRIRPAQKLVLTSGYTGGALDQFQLPRGLVFLPKPYSQKDLAEKLHDAVE